MRRGLSPIAGLAALICGGCLEPVHDCWPGLAVGEHIQLRLVDVYVEGGPYTWVRSGDPPGTPSCAARDGLTVGSVVEVELERSVGPLGCMEYIARPLSGIHGVDFSGMLLGGGLPAFFSTVTVASGDRWHLYAVRQAAASPIGERATFGEVPPIIVRRWIDGSAYCLDQWVGEVDLVGAAADGGGGSDAGP